MAGFLEALKSRCDVVELDGGRDWRRGVGEGEDMVSSWFDAEDERFDTAWQDMIARHGGKAIGYCEPVYRLLMPSS